MRKPHPHPIPSAMPAGRISPEFSILWLPSPEAARARVARRVREGGHSIPDHVIARRYFAGLRNMRYHYLPLVDIGIVYDNSDRGRVLIAERRSGDELIIRDRSRWNRILEATS